MTADAAGRDSYVARGGDGRYLRTADSIARDRQADALIAQGQSYQQVADRLGYADKSDAWRGVQRVRAEVAAMDGSTTMIRQRQLAGIAEQRRRLWDRLNNPAPLTDRLGRPCHDDSGAVIYDESAIAAWHALLIKLDQREAVIRGSDPPKRTVAINGNVTVEELAVILANTPKEDIHAAFAAANRIIEAETERLERDRMPAAIPGTLE